MSSELELTISDEQLLALGGVLLAGLSQAVEGGRTMVEGAKIALPGLILAAVAILIVLAVAWQLA